MVPGAHVINRLIVSVRSEEAKFFGLDEQALLLYIQRIRTADGQPIFERTSSCPMSGYQELLTMDLEDTSLFDSIARVGGHRPTRTPQRDSRGGSAPRRSRRRGWRSGGRPAVLFLNACFADDEDNPVTSAASTTWAAGPLRPVGKSARYDGASAERRHMRYAGITCRRPAAGRTVPGGGPAWQRAGGLSGSGTAVGSGSSTWPPHQPPDAQQELLDFPASARRRPTHTGLPSLPDRRLRGERAVGAVHSVASWSSRWTMVQRRRPLWAFAGTINGPRWKCFSVRGP